MHPESFATGGPHRPVSAAQPPRPVTTAKTLSLAFVRTLCCHWTYSLGRASFNDARDDQKLLRVIVLDTLPLEGRYPALPCSWHLLRRGRDAPRHQCRAWRVSATLSHIGWVFKPTFRPGRDQDGRLSAPNIAYLLAHKD